MVYSHKLLNPNESIKIAGYVYFDVKKSYLFMKLKQQTNKNRYKLKGTDKINWTNIWNKKDKNDKNNNCLFRDLVAKWVFA